MTEEAIIQFISARDLPGTVRKKLTVPDGKLALLVEGEELVGQRGPGGYHLGNWPKPAPDVVLLPQGPFDLRPRIRHLRSGDRQAFDLVWPLTLQVQDPTRFYVSWLASEPAAPAALIDLEDRLAGLLWDDAQQQTVQYSLDDLDTEEQVQASLGHAMRSTLASALHDLGLTMMGSQRPQPRTVDEERATLEAMNQAARLARDARFEALFERLEDKEMLKYRLQELAAEREEDPPDEALVDLLWDEVEQGPEDVAFQARQAARILERQIASLRMTLEGEEDATKRRFDQLVTHLERQEQVAGTMVATIAYPARLLGTVLWILRLVGYGLSALSGVVAILVPYLYEEWLPWRGGILVFTGIVGASTLILDLWVQRLRTQVRHQAIREKRRESRASLKRRQEADHLVRAHIETGLKLVANNLEAAWEKGYAMGGDARDLAVDLREVARRAGRFGEQEVRIANYRAGCYLAQDRVPDDYLSAVLDQDEDLLARSRSLAQTAETLYKRVNARQVDAARAALSDLEVGLNALRNRFTERSAFLMNPAQRG